MGLHALGWETRIPAKLKVQIAQFPVGIPT